jgi:hypothetical protein
MPLVTSDAKWGPARAMGLMAGSVSPSLRADLLDKPLNEQKGEVVRVALMQAFRDAAGVRARQLAAGVEMYEQVEPPHDRPARPLARTSQRLVVGEARPPEPSRGDEAESVVE